MLCDGSFDRFRISTIYDINLFAVLKVVEGRNRSDTLPLHQFGCFGGSISDNLQKYSIGILFTEIFKFGSNNFAGTTPEKQVQTIISAKVRKRIYRPSALFHSQYVLYHSIGRGAKCSACRPKMDIQILTMLYCSQQLPEMIQHS